MFVWNSRLSLLGVAGAVTLILAGLQHPLRGAPGAPVLNAATVNGPIVGFSWTAVAGATGYRLAAGLAPGAQIYTSNVGNVTTLSVTAPLGTFYVRVYAIDATGESSASNEVIVTVTSLTPAPAAPANLQVGLNVRTLLISWAAGPGGGTATTFVLVAGTRPGGTDLGTYPLGPVTQLTVPNAPVGIYYIRVYAQNAGGRSADSNEATVNMPTGGGCTPPPAQALSVSVFFNFVTLSWATFPGASGYRLDVSTTAGGAPVLTQSFGPTQSAVSFRGAPVGTFYGKITTMVSCGAQATSPETTIVVDNSAPPGPRTPNPAPGQELPIPSYAQSEVYRLAAAYAFDLRNSCHEFGGNNAFIFKVARELRKRDTRWGLNYRRGVPGSMSQDIITYNGSSEPDPVATRIQLIDIIGGHCGPSPSPSYIDQTPPTRAAGARGECANRDCALWTLNEYLAAGYPISPTDQP